MKRFVKHDTHTKQILKDY